MEYPCHNCKNRYTVCWSECETYKSFKAEQDRIKAEKKKYDDKTDFFIEMAMKRRPLYTRKGG